MSSEKECLMGKYWIFDRPIKLIVDAANCIYTKFTACVFLEGPPNCMIEQCSEL
jgi:hypothetical protein